VFAKFKTWLTQIYQTVAKLRSPISDEIFMELQRDSVAAVEMEMYEVWRRTFAPLLPLDLAVAAVVYLQPSLDVCMARVAGRARAGEAALPLAYQQRLRRAHQGAMVICAWVGAC
jgi:deoxyadenosine/deoxycytidine kinase